MNNFKKGDKVRIAPEHLSLAEKFHSHGMQGRPGTILVVYKNDFLLVQCDNPMKDFVLPTEWVIPCQGDTLWDYDNV